MPHGGPGRSGKGTLEAPAALAPCPVVASMFSLSLEGSSQAEGISQGSWGGWPEEEAERNGASLLGGVRLAHNCVTTQHLLP